MKAVSIHPAPPAADDLAPPGGLACPLPVRLPQPALLPPKNKQNKQTKTA